MRCALVLLLLRIAPAQTIALTGVTVVNPRMASAAPTQTIVIERERIVEVGSVRTVRIPAGARVVKGNGKFVVPGLWDMHVHVGEIEEDWFPLYLANGITGLREMAAPEKYIGSQRRYQAEIASRTRVGPDLFWTHSPMDAPAIWGEQKARAEVARRAAMGVRYIKVYKSLGNRIVLKFRLVSLRANRK